MSLQPWTGVRATFQRSSMTDTPPCVYVPIYPESLCPLPLEGLKLAHQTEASHTQLKVNKPWLHACEGAVIANGAHSTSIRDKDNSNSHGSGDNGPCSDSKEEGSLEFTAHGKGGCWNVIFSVCDPYRKMHTKTFCNIPSQSQTEEERKGSHLRYHPSLHTF
jgi:hypothetical protein